MTGMTTADIRNLGFCGRSRHRPERAYQVHRQWHLPGNLWSSLTGGRPAIMSEWPPIVFAVRPTPHGHYQSDPVVHFGAKRPSPRQSGSILENESWAFRYFGSTTGTITAARLLRAVYPPGSRGDDCHTHYYVSGPFLSGRRKNRAAWCHPSYWRNGAHPMRPPGWAP
jgi:hypothetical protein